VIRTLNSSRAAAAELRRGHTVAVAPPLVAVVVVAGRTTHIIIAKQTDKTPTTIHQGTN